MELHAFCANELSSFYFDIRKDSIYCDSKEDPKRLACLTVMNEIFKCISHWLAPILSFTSEEAWLAYQQNQDKSSIHLNTYPELPKEWNNNGLSNWEYIQDVRKLITESLEVERAAKTIGSSLEAEVYIYTNDLAKSKMLSKFDFAEIAIVSYAHIINAQAPSNAAYSDTLNVGVVVKKAQGLKCERCWKTLKEVEKITTEYGEIQVCKRCEKVIKK